LKRKKRWLCVTPKGEERKKLLAVPPWLRKNRLETLSDVEAGRRKVLYRAKLGPPIGGSTFKRPRE
jgi:hypothetical protein